MVAHYHSNILSRHNIISRSKKTLLYTFQQNLENQKPAHINISSKVHYKYVSNSIKDIWIKRGTLSMYNNITLQLLLVKDTLNLFHAFQCTFQMMFLFLHPQQLNPQLPGQVEERTVVQLVVSDHGSEICQVGFFELLEVWFCVLHIVKIPHVWGQTGKLGYILYTCILYY